MLIYIKIKGLKIMMVSGKLGIVSIK